MKTIILNFMFVFSFVSFVQAQQIKPIVSTQVNATLQKEKKLLYLMFVHLENLAKGILQKLQI